MKDTFKVYNNEAFVCCVIMKILSNTNRIDIGRLFLLVSVVLTDKITNDKKLSISNSINNYINDSQKILRLISTMYDELLPVILNSLTLLSENSNIELVENNQIVMIKNDFENISSDRLNNISDALPAIMRLTNNISTKQLYDNLKITL